MAEVILFIIQNVTLMNRIHTHGQVQVSQGQVTFFLYWIFFLHQFVINRGKNEGQLQLKKECVAVLIGLYKKKRCSFTSQNKFSLQENEKRTGKDVGMHWYHLIQVLWMGSYLQKLQHILSFETLFNTEKLRKSFLPLPSLP